MFGKPDEVGKQVMTPMTSDEVARQQVPIFLAYVWRLINLQHAAAVRDKEPPPDHYRVEFSSMDFTLKTVHASIAYLHVGTDWTMHLDGPSDTVVVRRFTGVRPFIVPLRDEKPTPFRRPFASAS